MSFQNEPIPAAAQTVGFTRLTFADDFESADTVDFSGEGKPGFLWYADRPFGKEPMKEDEVEFHDSYVRVKSPTFGMAAYSKKGNRGFAMQSGYVEARIRIGAPPEQAWRGPLFHIFVLP